MKSLYEDLGVPKTATPEQIKAAHRKGVREHHPDKNGCREKFQAVQHAYEVLSDPEKRRRYDETGDDGSRTPGAPSAEALIADAWNTVIEHCDPEQDLLEVLRSTIRDAAKNAQRHAQQAERKLAKFETMLKRIRVGPESVLRGVLQHRCQEQRRAREQNEHAAAVLNDAVKLLDGAGYQHEPMFRQRPENGTKGTDRFMQSILEEMMRDAGTGPRARKGGRAGWNEDFFGGDPR